MPPLRVLIADDHQLFAETLGLTLDFDERVEVAGSARNGKEAVRLALDLQPDAVLMDLEMPVLDGLHATRLLRRLLPACPVVVLTASPSSEDVHRARSAGAPVPPVPPVPALPPLPPLPPVSLPRLPLPPLPTLP